MKILEIIQQPEGRRLEFKELLPTSADLAKTIVAFANDAGGELFIGIRNDPRELVGIPDDDIMKVEEQISSIIHDQCYPVIVPDISIHGEADVKYIRVQIFRGSNFPYYIKAKGKHEGTFIRVGSSNRQADPEIIAELERQKRNISFDSEIIHDKTASDFNINPFKDFFKEKTGEELDETTLRKLELLKLYHGNWLPTNAYALFSELSARKELFPYAKIECARFKGTTSEFFIDQKTIDVNISFQAEAAYEFILRHINKSASVKGVYTETRWEYPVVAIREAIRNAVVHRDYSLIGKDIKVAVYDDMVEINVPGKLMPAIDFSELEIGQSDIRNRIIAPVFKKIGVIDQWGNGLKLIADELKKYPEIEFKWFERGLQFQVQFIKRDYKIQLELQQEIQPESQLELEIELQLESQPELLLELQKPSMYSKVLSIIENGKKGKKQISVELGQKSISGQLNKTINKLLKDLFITKTIPDIETSSNQQYYLSEKGKIFLKKIKSKRA